MNILYINHYAGSPKLGMEYRPYYLAKEWVKLGHNVTIVCATYSHVRSIQPEISNDFIEEDIDGIKYLWITTPKYEGNGLGRVKNIFTFIFKIYKRINWFVKTKSPDLVIASSTYPLDNYIAKRIAKKAKAKHVYEVHDLWPLSLIELGGFSTRHPFIMLLQHAENFAYKNCDKVVSMLPKAKDHMISHGLKSEKFTFIPNGIELCESDHSLPNEHQKTLEEIKSKNLRIVGYAGTHGVANALDFFIDAISSINNPEIAFVFVGKGYEKENLIEQARRNNISNIWFLPPVEKTAMPLLLEQFDILYIGWRKKSIYRFGICPNKLMDYMYAGKPIIHAVEAGNDLVKDSNCGLSIRPESIEELKDAINVLIDMPGDELGRMGDNGKKYVIDNHEYRVLAKQFLDSI